MNRCTLCWAENMSCESCREAARAKRGLEIIKTQQTGIVDISELKTLLKNNKMKFPKNWNKRTLDEQEKWLVEKLQDVYSVEKKIRVLLSQVRGGNKVELIAEERPDENLL